MLTVRVKQQKINDFLNGSGKNVIFEVFHIPLFWIYFHYNGIKPDVNSLCPDETQKPPRREAQEFSNQTHKIRLEVLELVAQCVS
jgi:hypothetical protein